MTSETTPAPSKPAENSPSPPAVTTPNPPAEPVPSPPTMTTPSPPVEPSLSLSQSADPAVSQLDRIETQLAAISREVYELGRVRQEIDDLREELTLIAKDMTTAACEELEGVAFLNREGEFATLARNLLRNTANFNYLLNQLESAMDFVHDATPVSREVFRDAVASLEKLEEQGYFALIQPLKYLLDNLVYHFRPEDLCDLAEHLPEILSTVRNLSQPEMLKAVDNAALILRSLDPATVKPTSAFKIFREINTPEMRRALGLLITFLKRFSQVQFEPRKAEAQAPPEQN